MDQAVEHQTFQVDGLTYTIHYKPTIKEDGRELMGLTERDNLRISVSLDQALEAQDVTFCHEVGHLFYDELAPIIQGKHPDKVELFCERFAHLMHGMLKQNKEFLRDYIARYI